MNSLFETFIGSVGISACGLWTQQRSTLYLSPSCLAPPSSLTKLGPDHLTRHSACFSSGHSAHSAHRSQSSATMGGLWTAYMDSSDSTRSSVLQDIIKGITRDPICLTLAHQIAATPTLISQDDRKGLVQNILDDIEASSISKDG